MTGTTFDKFCVILSNLTPGNGPKWNAGVMQIYQIGLRDVPNEAASMLTEAIIDACTFRPSVAQIKELYREITQGERLSAVGLVARIMALRGYYGPNGQIDNSLGTKRFYVLGEPADLTDEERRVVSVWGGWVNFAQEPNLIPAVILRVAQQVVDGVSSEVVQRLRLEFQSAQAALPAPAINIGHEEAAALPEPAYADRREASSVMERMGRLLPAPEKDKVEA